MIYLIQDCFKDNSGNYSDVLKIGYSSEAFSKIRKPDYNSQNYGYKFLGEHEGSRELEKFIHTVLKNFNLSGEWFKYDEKVIDTFWKTDESDIIDFLKQGKDNLHTKNRLLKIINTIISIISTDSFKSRCFDEITQKIKERFPNETLDIYMLNKTVISKTFKELLGFCKNYYNCMFDYFYELDFNNDNRITGILQKSSNTWFIECFKLYSPKAFDNLRETYEKITKDKIERTECILSCYKNFDAASKNIWGEKLLSGYKLFKFSDDFISVNNSKIPRFNELAEKTYEYTWQISLKNFENINELLNLK